MWQRLLLLVLGLAAVLGVAVWFERSLDPINPATFERIKEGMTLEEVVAVIGKPPGDYRSTKKYILPPTPGRYWVGDSYAIHVDLDLQGNVENPKLGENFVPHPSIPDRIRAWFAGWK